MIKTNAVVCFQNVDYIQILIHETFQWRKTSPDQKEILLSANLSFSEEHEEYIRHQENVLQKLFVFEGDPEKPTLSILKVKMRKIEKVYPSIYTTTFECYPVKNQKKQRSPL